MNESKRSAAAQALLGLDSVPVTGQWEPMHLLLTADAEGTPSVCLLSRTELKPVGMRIHAAVASKTARADLERTGRQL